MNAERKIRVGVFHPGTQHAWQTELGFQEAGLLAWFATSVFYDPARWPYRAERYIPRSFSECLHRNIARCYSSALDPRNVRQFGLREWFETGARRPYKPL